MDAQASIHILHLLTIVHIYKLYFVTYLFADSQTLRHTDSWTDRLTHRYIEVYTDRHRQIV